MRSVTSIVIITLAGLLLFKEKLTKRQGTALGMIMVALAMLNM
jgi:multidrug transporter EmrE-like cation transporter